jgi:hypothetical protein
MKRLALVITALALLLGACGDDGDDGDTLSDDTLTDVLVANGVPEELADCIGDKIDGDIDTEAIESGDAEASQELFDASADCAVEAVESGEFTPEELQDLGNELSE